jgi:hypothetical protein
LGYGRYSNDGPFAIVATIVITTVVVIIVCKDLLSDKGTLAQMLYIVLMFLATYGAVKAIAYIINKAR